MSYAIRVTNVTTDTATNVTLTNVLPSGLVFIDALPPPKNQTGNTLTWVFPSLDSGASKLLVLRAALDSTVVPGQTLINTIEVTDDRGNLADASSTIRVHGVQTNAPPLTLIMTTVKRTFPRSQLRYTFNVKNTGVPIAHNVVLTTAMPPGTTFVLSTPPVSKKTGTQLTWNLGTLVRSAQSVVRLSLTVNDNVQPGTVLSTSADVNDAGGDTASASADVNVVAK